MNGRPLLARLAAALRRGQKVPDDVLNWFCEAEGATQAGANPCEAFGLTSSRPDRQRRNDHLRAAANKMRSDLSASQRAARILSDADRLAPFLMKPWGVESDKPWSVDVIMALRAAPLPSEHELRKIIVGGF